eukprot:12419685-Karenia_brevis.AAC.1
MAPRMVKVVADNCISACMRIQEWPAPSNNPTLGIKLDYEAVLAMGATIADRVCQLGEVTVDRVPPPQINQENMAPHIQ